MSLPNLPRWYDDYRLRTPEEDRPRRPRTQADLEDGTPYDGDSIECEYCHEWKPAEDFASKTQCTDCYCSYPGDPPDDDDDEPEEPTDPEATPIVTGDDPDEVLPDQPELGGESG